MPATLQPPQSPAAVSGVADSRHWTRRGVLPLAVPAILLAIVSLVPYLNKAYTIDDPLFLLSARQILRNPLQPMSYPVCWMSNESCVNSAANLGPLASQALMGYALVPVVLLGGAEWIAHLLQIVYAMLAIVAMVRLGVRLGLDRKEASLAGLMLAAIPPFLSMASTAMPDMLAIALGFTGFDRLLAWREQRRWRDAAIVMFCLGLAPYARPHLALLLPLGALWLFDGPSLRQALRKLCRESYLWIPLVLATAILFAVIHITRDRGPALEAHDAMVSWDHVPRNLLSYFQYLAYPIPFAAMWLTVRWRRTPLLLLAPGLAVAILHFLTDPGFTLFQRWPFMASAYGLTAVISMLRRYWTRPDWTYRLLSLWVLLPVPVVIYTHMPMKYMIGAMPAVILILLRELSELPPRRAAVISRVMVVVCAGFSWVLLRADADFAEYSRRAAAELIAPRVSRGESVWYAPGQWGFYWYAQQAGAVAARPGQPRPRRGDLLVVALIEGGGATLKRFPQRQLLETQSYDSPHGRTMGYGGALYSNSCGDAPWIWNPRTTNDYQVWRIQ